MGRTGDVRCTSSEISDALAILEKMDDVNLQLIRNELDRLLKSKKTGESQTMGQIGGCGASVQSVFLGAKFSYRTVAILGAEYADSRKPPYEGKVLTIVAFEPHCKNNVVVQDSNGARSLLPLSMVERGLSLSPVLEDRAENRLATLNDALKFVAHAQSSELDALVEQISEARKGLDVNAAARLKVGDLVARDSHDGRQELKGSITQIYAGRVIIRNPDGCPTSVPAGSVRRVEAGTCDKNDVRSLTH